MGKDKNGVELKKKDVVQIVNVEHPWYSAFIIVDDIRTWGIQGYYSVVSNDPKVGVGLAYTRLEYAEIQKIGEAVVDIGI